MKIQFFNFIKQNNTVLHVLILEACCAFEFNFQSAFVWACEFLQQPINICNSLSPNLNSHFTFHCLKQSNLSLISHRVFVYNFYELNMLFIDKHIKKYFLKQMHTYILVLNINWIYLWYNMEKLFLQNSKLTPYISQLSK